MDVRFEDAKAHVDEYGKSQSLKEHLHNVARLASEYAAFWGCEGNGYYAGLYHDIGKCSKEFEERLEGGKIVDHSSAGAYLMLLEKRLAESIVIASHHSGLLNMVPSNYSPNFISYHDRLNCKKQFKEFDKYLEVLGHPDRENNALGVLDKEHMDPMEWFIAIHFLFSCLVDADYTDTARFFCTEKEFKPLDFKIVCDKIFERAGKYLSNSDNNSLNMVRNQMLQECIKKGELDQGIYTLTIPTGGGKTFSSLAFAASHARKHPNIRRIIYVIPYLSIIEQNAEVIREIVGNEYVLEHHSASPVFADKSESEESSRLLLATENWDIPIVITTNEQFFESLFSHKASKCRKLHNIVDSVIIFDEAQMLPLKYLSIFFFAIRELVDNKRYGITAVLCTATQPNLERFLGRIPKELIPLELSSNEIFRRYHIEDIGVIKDISLFCDKLSDSDQVLVIVNLKKSAKEIYENLPEEGRFYLTTNLTPYSRKKVLAKIKERLSSGKTCRVVSTSLIEAGVDVDFPVVYREINGLDSIIQSGGRCNREGKQALDESIVYVFDLEKMEMKEDYSRKVSALKAVCRHHTDLLDADSISDYYETYYKDSYTDECSEFFNCSIYHMLFRTIGESVKIIDKDNKGIFICQNQEGEEILKQIKAGIITRSLIRKTAEYTAQCSDSDLEKLLASGAISKLSDFLFVLENNLLYNEFTGITLSRKNNEVIIV